MKRAVLFAAVAVALLLCAAVGVWLALTRSVAETVSAQARVAGELLDAGVPLGEGFVRSVVRPGVHVLAADHRTGLLVDGGSRGVHVLSGAPPPPEGGIPGGGPPRPGAAGSIALGLARIPPARVERADRTVEIAPDALVLASWLTAETVLLLVAVAAVVTFAVNRSAAHAREQRRALELRAAEQAVAAERYQRFLAEAGHELRTPLTVISGYVDILRSHRPGEPLDQRVVEGMHAETTRMRTLVEKMMTLARLDSDAGVPRLVDVATAAREAAQTLRRRFPERDVDVLVEQTASVIVDADDYAAALGNLLENAVKYAPESTVTIVTAVRDGRAGTAVIDRGPGIPPSARDAIFGRFYRAHDGGDGLGLGLAIVKRVADRWNGSVACESGNGRTVFRLDFPLADEEPRGAR